MTHLPFLARITETLLYQEGETDPEIRTLSLMSLNDSDRLSWAVLLWTQTGWFGALAATGWRWLLVFVLLDLALFIVRWRLRRSTLGTGIGQNGISPVVLVPINLGLVALIATDVFVLTQAHSERATFLACILAIGFSGYLVSVFSAFTVLATLNIVMVTAAFELGIATGDSDTARPFALLIPGGTIAHWLLMKHNHENLIGALRNQRAHYLLSRHDPLTKLPNRSFMRETLARHLSTMGAGGPCRVAVLCLDLDGFKEINDRFGHAAGDWVLVHVAGILREFLAPGDMACRIGGDEYVALLPGSDEARVRSVSRSIIAATAQPFDTGRAVQARIGVSIGAAIADGPDHDLDGLLEEADLALYAAKRNGKGQLVIGSLPAAIPSEVPGQSVAG